MSNRRRGPRSFQYVHYLCESCQEDFSVLTVDQSKDPYPQQPDTPREENQITCTPCRRAQENAFDEVMKGYES